MGATQSRAHSQSTNIASLPAEVRQRIAANVAGPQLPFPRCFKELKHQRIVDLCNCALVSQAFYRLAEPLLFRCVALQLDPMPSVSEKLREEKDKTQGVERPRKQQPQVSKSMAKRNGQAHALSHFPRLRQHVHALTINGSLLGGGGPATGPPFEEMRDEIFHWLQLCPELVALKLISFGAVVTFPMLVAWLPLIPKPALAQLTSLWIEPRLKHGPSKRYAAAFTGFENRFDAETSLKELVIDTSIDPGWCSFAKTTNKYFPALEHLELSAEALPALPRCVYSSEKSLRTLHVISNHGSWEFSSSFTLAKLTELTTLHLEETNAKDIKRTVDQVKDLPDLLKFRLTSCNPKTKTPYHLDCLPSNLQRICLDTQILSVDVLATVNSIKFDRAKITWSAQRSWSEEEEAAVEEAVERRKARNAEGSWSTWATAAQSE